jgi:hypothetical protein
MVFAFQQQNTNKQARLLLADKINRNCMIFPLAPNRKNSIALLHTLRLLEKGELV